MRVVAKTATTEGAWLVLLAALVALAAAPTNVLANLQEEEAEGGADSLKSALEAISRRQRDLAALGGGATSPAGLAGSGLTQYRLRDPAGELAFLTPLQDFPGDGQPEDIGYGYQKSAASSSESAGHGVGGGSPVGAGANNRALEQMLLEYLEDGGFAGPMRDQAEAKRAASVFRERVGLGAPLPPLLRKRKVLAPPSSFRERAHADTGAQKELGQEERRQRVLAEALARELEMEEAAQALAERQREQEVEEEQEHENQREEEQKEGEYMDLLQDIWHKYKQTNPEIRRIEDLSPEDVEVLISNIVDGGAEEEPAVAKRQYGGYDFFNNMGAMGGWQAGGMYRKRSKQRLDADGPGAGDGNGFLYSLKFVAPAAHRDALEALAEDDSAELADERDDDALRLAAGEGLVRREGEWERADEVAALEAANDDEDYQRLALAQAAAAQAAAQAAERRRQFAESRFGPRKRFLVGDGALVAKRKRYPVTKRSSDFYASPPLMHRRTFADGLEERRKRKDAAAAAAAAAAESEAAGSSGTDPKVARELNQIFSSDGPEQTESHTGAVTPASDSAMHDRHGGGSTVSASPEATSATVPANAGASSNSSSSSVTASSSGHLGGGGAKSNGSRELTPEEQREHSLHHHDDDSVSMPSSLLSPKAHFV